MISRVERWLLIRSTAAAILHHGDLDRIRATLDQSLRYETPAVRESVWAEAVSAAAIRRR